jgi:ribosomal protein S6--L-glutamate ligase
MRRRGSSKSLMRRVALGAQLRGCAAVATIGVRPNLSDYEPWEMDLIEQASKIYFPTVLYADTLDAMGKKTFPNVHNYRHLGDKIKQTLLFQLLGVPMPRTRLYYGRHGMETILDEFDFPFIGKMPRGSARGEGVYLIKQRSDLHAYLSRTRVAYIQQYVPLRRDLRIVIIGKRIVLTYWKEAAPGEFRTNLAMGGTPHFDAVPDEALEFALEVAVKCSFDHVGLDLVQDDGRFLVLEGNMVFGREGFRAAGLDYRQTLMRMVKNGEI